MAQSQTIIVIAIVAALIAIAAFVLVRRAGERRRDAALRDRFGSEYDRVANEATNPAEARAVLSEREKRVAGYTLRPLTPQLRQHFVTTWQNVQAQFVDDPAYAVTRADDLLGEVMVARGYPMADWSQQEEDISVDHAEVVSNFRSAHAIAQAHRRGEAGTEDLRTAMIHYRALFDDLVNEPERGSAMPSPPTATTTA